MPRRRIAEPAARPAADEAAFAGELRDGERAIALWRRQAAEHGRPPPVAAFDFATSASEWASRFVICGDAMVEDATFLFYGPVFAQRLELPRQPVADMPVMRQLPGRYRPLFAEGCGEAMARAAPATFSGAVINYGKIELYRAAFMPLRLRLDSPVQLVFGTFNYYAGPRADAADAFSTTATWLRDVAQWKLKSPGELG